MRDRYLRGGLAAFLILCGSAAFAQEPQAFAQTASASNTYEIETSKLALAATQSDPVRAFAEQMIADHTAAGQKMAAAAQTDGVAVAAAMTEDQQAKAAQLRGLSDADFDAAYVAAQVAAHDEAVSLFEAFVAQSQPSALRDFAAETLPVLEQHQAHAHSLKQGR